MPIPPLRYHVLNAAPARSSGDYVLYWMIAARRAAFNFALDHALAEARTRKLPLVVFEPLRAGYAWASERFHRFVVEGMADNQRAFARSPVLYFPYLEPEPGAGKGLLEALARHAALVVTDLAPVFFLPRMVTSAARKLDVRLDAIDGNGLLPLAATDRTFPTAYVFRRFLQKSLAPHLDAEAVPCAKPLLRVRLPRLEALPAAIRRRWAAADLAAVDLARFPIDHGVGPVPEGGGHAAARAALDRFLLRGLPRYASERSQPASGAASGLSPWLHFGHISVHEVFAALVEQEQWSPDRLARSSRGEKSGWWGMSEGAESFLDELVTWRELGHHMAHKNPDSEQFSSLPPWALKTLAAHARDRRPWSYTLAELEQAGTHDDIWNAAQTELRCTGRMHNYLRMLWGKKVLEWSPSPEEAAARLIHLNNKYALDGRDPNSYSGIYWCFGRYDRPWAPQRPVFGSVRFMSSEATRKKLRMRAYLERFGPGARPWSPRV